VPLHANQDRVALGRRFGSRSTALIHFRLSPLQRGNVAFETRRTRKLSAFFVFFYSYKNTRVFGSRYKSDRQASGVPGGNSTYREWTLCYYRAVRTFEVYSAQEIQRRWRKFFSTLCKSGMNIILLQICVTTHFVIKSRTIGCVKIRFTRIMCSDTQMWLPPTSTDMNAYNNLLGQPEGKRALGRPRHSWVDDTVMGLKER
jgi:hypothetical protein